ncbi:mitochondrial-processing peptidase subunit beta [Megachile rotundata]|uniref:mitochondrial-processing peptidase subunit beta n=1 Tax=Megachile rotundata TaxID=143995 RepID=UPI003FD31B99
MMVISKYLCYAQGNKMLNCIKKGCNYISNNYYKYFGTCKGTSKKEVSNKYSEQIESCYTSNGMRLVCEYRDSFTTTLGCLVPAGAMHEMPKERGSAIFLEHLLLRRTECHNQEQLEMLLGEIGGKISTIALRDMFIIYGTVAPCEVDKLVHIFADIIFNSIICDEDVEREKCVILYELSKMESEKEKVIMDYLPTIAYQDTALANSVYPETNVIKKFCSETLVEFQKRTFKTHLMTMICTGSICLEELQRIVYKYFDATEDHRSSLDCSNNTQSCTDSLEYRFSGSDLRLRDDDDELGYVAIGVEGPGSEEWEDHFTLTVAKEFVGCWDTSSGGANHNAPLIAHYSFNTDLCYLYKSFFHKWAQSTSIWGCYFVCSKLNLENMIDMIQREWMKLCICITEKEVARAVNQCKMKELMIQNNPTNRFFDIVKHIFRYGCYDPIPNRVAEYEKVTPDKVRVAAEKYIYDQSPAVVAMGRIENLPPYYVIRNGMFLLRY